MLKKYLILLISIVVLTSCVPKQDGSEQKTVLLVSAAVSLKDSLNEIKKQFEEENPSIEVRYNFSSTGALQRQIEQGAPVDVFFSASKALFEQLNAKGLINQSLQMDYLGNSLVLITNKENEALKMEDLASEDFGKLAIGTPETVPAGKYAKEALVHDDLWESNKKRMVFAKDVRQVLSYVETGNVHAGIVYKTDAMTSKKVNQTPIEPAKYESIIYPAGVLNETEHENEAKAFFFFLQQEQSIEVFEQQGFEVLHKGDRDVD
ncbi:molybdate ABC transporter substrate-binding protein [Metabacillus idriensis]|uniref:molybdate ABC transporter substrate-binding protein n=1 Tax=Metabacillus idriensis TaxID=324768 RepID=UPI003D2C11E7